MNALVPIALFGWVPASIFAFSMLRPHRAALVTLIGGWLFLPTSRLDMPGLPYYSKAMAIAFGLVFGALLAGRKGRPRFRFRLFDLPVIVFCFGAVVTSVLNGLGLYDGVSDALQNAVFWGVPYFIGRMYFSSPEALRDLAIGLVIGGMVYGLLCLYELRMSPRINLNVYGFLQHDWRQHKRYGGWRPLVFMHHGLMVALWMAVTTTVAFWLWRSRIVSHIRGLPLAVVTPVLAVITVLCKAAGAVTAMALGVGAYYLHQKLRMRRVLVALLMVFPAYVALRMTGVVSAESVESLARGVFDVERVESLAVRLSQEDPFIDRTMSRPLFGWGGHGRNWPVDPLTGTEAVRQVDAFWLTTASKYGLVGLLSLLAVLLTGPLLALRAVVRPGRRDDLVRMMPAVLSLPVSLFLIDSVFNGMGNPAYTLVAGALAGFSAART